MNGHLEAEFPNLRNRDYSVTSPTDPAYNCIAWAASDSLRFWWPVRQNPFVYWPRGVARDETLEAFIHAFETLGFAVCDNTNVEERFEKIAIYANAAGVPKHAARQLRNGRWTSKLGRDVDIEHTL